MVWVRNVIMWLRLVQDRLENLHKENLTEYTLAINYPNEKGAKLMIFEDFRQ